MIIKKILRSGFIFLLPLSMSFPTLAQDADEFDIEPGQKYKADEDSIAPRQVGLVEDNNNSTPTSVEKPAGLTITSNGESLSIKISDVSEVQNAIDLKTAKAVDAAKLEIQKSEYKKNLDRQVSLQPKIEKPKKEESAPSTIKSDDDYIMLNDVKAIVGNAETLPDETTKFTKVPTPPQNDGTQIVTNLPVFIPNTVGLTGLPPVTTGDGPQNNNVIRDIRADNKNSKIEFNFTSEKQ